MKQLEMPFENIVHIFEWMKRKRWAWLKKTWIFSDHELDFLLKITYDLTDKDFEYFIAILLEKEGFETSISGGRNDAWVDIIAKIWEKTFSIQCKQWAKARITLQDAWKYYASIFQKMKQNNDYIYAYVTTSYIPKDVEDYLREHGIQGMISNLKIIQESKKLWFFTENGWKKLIAEIRDRRLKDLFMLSQLPLFEVEKNLKKELIKNRLKEIKNHLPTDLRYKKSIISFKDPIHKKFYENFFAHWDL